MISEKQSKQEEEVFAITAVPRMLSRVVVIWKVVIPIFNAILFLISIVRKILLLTVTSYALPSTSLLVPN